MEASTCSNYKKFGHEIAQCKLQPKEDLKKIASSEIPNPPVAFSKSSSPRLAADSGNQTKKMDFGNEGCHDIDIGSKRNTAALPLPKASSPCIVPLALFGKIDASQSGAACSDSQAGVEVHGQHLLVSDADGPWAPVLVDSSCPGLQGSFP
ncbi:hypothetical protein Nepgr_002808 [Nepenthes gracilis]|uniref:Uncharacterized protein n=1 Tax=Nepenthes gracilis TaxID=150966 RepID=A0AAD3PA28_NEPGR|nr:hypothetical protein Nepgr_002808 [Nepenthes gracilis]